jgi:2-(1,2-epoxy-1,2-dihydrophenyl)acetyl-CoA isomerase
VSPARYRSVEGLGVVLDEAGVLHVELDRPAKRNSLDDSMVEAFIETLEQANEDPAVRVVTVTGAGENFCSGFDLLSRNADGESQRPRPGSIQRRLPAGPHRLIPLITSVQVPVVCAVRGWAVGLGLHVVLAADFALVTEDARLWEPFMQRGFTPDSGASWLLPRRIGMVRAREMLLLGRILTGMDAAEAGMVHAAVPPQDLDRAVSSLVEELAAGPTVALGLTKWLLDAGSARPLAEQLADEAYALEVSSRTEDFREGLAAMRERRRPTFRGR